MTYAFDPALAEAATTLPRRDLTDVAGARRAMAAAIAARPPVDPTGVAVEDRTVPGRPDVAVRVFRPAAAGLLPAILHAHGGGFVMGDVASSHNRNVELARELGALVVSVEYRLAPEHPYPAASDDLYTALLWLAGQPEVDRDRIGVHGISAGAGLVAGLALRVRDQGGPPLRFQYLGIPVLDDRLTTPSVRRFVDTPQWDAEQARLGWAAYLGEATEVSPYAAPARATDLSGLPPAYLSAMEFDPLRDEAVAYAQALLGAGVTTELHVYPGTFHGSSAFRDAAVSRRELAEEIAVLRAGLVEAPGRSAPERADNTARSSPERADNTVKEGSQ